MPAERIQRTVCDACGKTHEEKTDFSANDVPQGWYEVFVTISGHKQATGPNAWHYRFGLDGKHFERPRPEVYACSEECIRKLLAAFTMPTDEEIAKDRAP